MFIRGLVEFFPLPQVRRLPKEKGTDFVKQISPQLFHKRANGESQVGCRACLIPFSGCGKLSLFPLYYMSQLCEVAGKKAQDHKSGELLKYSQGLPALGAKQLYFGTIKVRQSHSSMLEMPCGYGCHQCPTLDTAVIAQIHNQEWWKILSPEVKEHKRSLDGIWPSPSGSVLVCQVTSSIAGGGKQSSIGGIITLSGPFQVKALFGMHTGSAHLGRYK